MCGITGIWNFSGEPVNEVVLERMTDELQARGPDDSGLHLEGGIGLGHRRLTIIDLSKNGRQPMSDESGTLWITFNGEIYNYKALRENLQRQGHHFRSTSDTEVIPQLYQHDGPACIEKLEGMFAFGLWDRQKKQLLLARDRLGIKPLYYAKRENCFLFASEIKALLKHPQLKAELNEAALSQYLTFKTTPAPNTLFKGIYKLPPGHFMLINAQGEIKIQRYWDTHMQSSQPEEIDAPTSVYNLLEQAVKDRLVADVPVGAFLSGGLDSSVIVALMAKHKTDPIKTYSIGIHDLSDVNELDYARMVAKACKTDHTELMMGQKDVQAYLPKLVHTQDEPLADPVSIPLYYLAKRVKEDGVSVVLVGEGSDELFYGYQSRLEFLKNYQQRWAPLLKLPNALLHSLHLLSRCLNLLIPGTHHYTDILKKALNKDELFWGSPGLSPAMLKDLYPQHDSAQLQGILNSLIEPLLQQTPTADVGARVSYIDLKLRLAELLLMRTDKITMSVGLEARVPFLDHRLVEYLMKLPVDKKVPNLQEKWLLKNAVQSLVPDAILKRKKMAFAAPINLWLRAGLAEFAQSQIFDSKLRQKNIFNYDLIHKLFSQHLQGKQDHGVAIWTLVNLSAWYDHWF